MLRDKISVLVNFGWIFAGNSIYAVCQWLMLVSVAKLGTEGMVGQFALAQTITIPIYSFTLLQLRALLVTDTMKEHSFASYLLLRRLSNVLALFLVSLVVVLSGYTLEISLVILAFAFTKAIEGESDILHGALQRSEKMNRIAVSLALKGIVSVLAMAIMVKWLSSVFAGIVVMSLGWLCVLVCCDRRFVQELLSSDWDSECGDVVHKYEHRQKSLIALLVKAIPLGVVYLLVMLIPHIPRYVLEKSAGVPSLGVYAALMQLTLAGYQVLAALGQVASPRIARCRANHDVRGLRRWLLRLIGVCLLLGIAGVAATMCVGKLVLSIVYNDKYALFANEFTVMVFAAALTWMGSGAGFWLTAMQIFRPQVYVQAVGVVLVIITSLWLIPHWGIMGTAWVQVVVGGGLMIMQIGYSLLVLVKFQKEKAGCHSKQMASVV